MNFYNHLLSYYMDKTTLSEALNVFGMMRNKIIDDQLDKLVTKKKDISQDDLQNYKDELQAQMKDVATTDLVTEFSKITPPQPKNTPKSLTSYADGR